MDTTPYQHLTNSLVVLYMFTRDIVFSHKVICFYIVVGHFSS